MHLIGPSLKENKTYILFIENNRLFSLHIGRGLFCKFPSGVYIYIGSAKKNLKKRILRHFSNKKKLYWHIDYFLVSTDIIDVYVGQREEKELVSVILREKNPKIPCKGFGATDSPHPSHLFLVENKEDIEKFLLSLGFRKYSLDT